MGNYLCNDAEHSKQAKKENHDNRMLPSSDKGKPEESGNILTDDNPDIPFADSVADEGDQCLSDDGGQLTVESDHVVSGCHLMESVVCENEKSKHENQVILSEHSEVTDEKKEFLNGNSAEFHEDNTLREDVKQKIEECQHESTDAKDECTMKVTGSDEHEHNIIFDNPNLCSSSEVKEESYIVSSHQDAHRNSEEQLTDSAVVNVYPQEDHNQAESVYHQDILNDEEPFEVSKVDLKNLDSMTHNKSELCVELSNEESNEILENINCHNDIQDPLCSLSTSNQELRAETPSYSSGHRCSEHSTSSVENINEEELKNIVSEIVEDVIREARHSLQQMIETSESQSRSSESAQSCD